MKTTLGSLKLCLVDPGIQEERLDLEDEGGEFAGVAEEEAQVEAERAWGVVAFVHGGTKPDETEHGEVLDGLDGGDGTEVDAGHEDADDGLDGAKDDGGDESESLVVLKEEEEGEVEGAETFLADGVHAQPEDCRQSDAQRVGNGGGEGSETDELGQLLDLVGDGREAAEGDADEEGECLQEGG